jgi:transcription elongation GreA/GreB family factor
MNNPTALKNQIHRACIDQIEERIKTLEKRVATIEASKVKEMESTIGEVFETGKTMIQMDGQKFRQQLNINRSELVQLQQVIHDNNLDLVKNGSLVETDHGLYYIAIGLGEMDVKGQTYYCVSKEAPVGKALIGAKVGDKVETDQAKLTILEIH